MVTGSNAADFGLESDVGGVVVEEPDVVFSTSEVKRGREIPIAIDPPLTIAISLSSRTRTASMTQLLPFHQFM
jgi:hypothetical protein